VFGELAHVLKVACGRAYRTRVPGAYGIPLRDEIELEKQP
jgi:hypothetical protein